MPSIPRPLHADFHAEGGASPPPPAARAKRSAFRRDVSRLAAHLWAMGCRAALMLTWLVILGTACILGLCYPFAAVLLIFFGGVTSARAKRYSGAYGSARWATRQDLERWELTGSDGLVLGKLSGGNSFRYRLRQLYAMPVAQSAEACCVFRSAGQVAGGGQLIRLSNFVHLATYAAAGRGKGVAVVIPNLLVYEWSCVVIDFKCENYFATAEHRQRNGHVIVRIDPWLLGGKGGACFNALESIHPESPDCLDRCRDIADMMIPPEPGIHAHWRESALLFLTAALAFVVCHGEAKNKHLQAVRDIICDPGSLVSMHGFLLKSAACGGMLRRLGASLSYYIDKELASVMTTLNRMTAWMDSLPIAACMQSSSFDARDLRRRKMTVYVVIPESQIKLQAPFLRLVVGCLLRAVTSFGPTEENPTLFLLDEAAQFSGQLQAIQDALTLLRGFGVRLWFIFQSTGQVKTCFGEQETTFFDNIDTSQFFGLNSVQSADMVSQNLGDATIGLASDQVSTTHSRPSGTSFGGPPGQGQISKGTSTTFSEHGRRLLQASEIIRLPEDEAIIIHRNMPPIRAKLAKYFETPQLFERANTAQPRLGLWEGVRDFLVCIGTCVFAAAVLVIQFDVPLPAIRGPVAQQQAAERQAETADSRGRRPARLYHNGRLVPPRRPETGRQDSLFRPQPRAYRGMR